MSLNRQQREITSRELKANFLKSGMSQEALAKQLNVSIKEVQNILDVETHGDLMTFIHQVWDARDIINEELASKGMTPEPYSYIKGQKEDYWFLR